jgi:hypothetical protein
MLPTPKKTATTYTASAHRRSLLARVRPVVWLGLALVLIVVCLNTYLLARSLFRPHFTPVLAPSAAALLPTTLPSATPTPRPFATGIAELVWTVDMQAIGNGQYLPPENVKSAIQSAWEGALTDLDALPWENSALQAAFTGPALANLQQNGADPSRVDAGYLTKTIPGVRRFTLVGCNRSGDTCDVTEAFGRVSLDQYDSATHQKVGTVQLDASLLYLFKGTLTWGGDRWHVSALDEPVTGSP